MSSSANPSKVEQDTAVEDVEADDVGVVGAVAEVKDNLFVATAELKETIISESKIEEHRRALRESVPEAAALVPAEHTVASLGLPACLEVVMDVELPFYGEPHRLFIVRWVQAGAAEERAAPARQIIDILDALHDCGGVLATAPQWPLHDYAVCTAIMAMEIEELAHGTGMEELPCWRRTIGKVLRFLRITAPSQERVAAFEMHFGPAVEVVFSWTALYIQQSWFLVLYAILWLIVRPWSFRSTELRWLFDLMQAVVVIWAFWMAFYSTRKFHKPDHGVRSKVRRGEVVLSTWKEHEDTPSKVKRFLVLCLAVFPVLLVKIFLSIALFTFVVMLVLRVIFLWGECIHVRIEEVRCINAEFKWGFVGWLVQVSCDILIALLFEAFYGLGFAVASWTAGLLNYKYKSDLTLCKEMLDMCLRTIHRVGFVGSLAFLFVPQWEKPLPCTMEGAYDSCPCDDFDLGEADYRCFQRRLPQQTRLWIFQTLLIGPFIVAPNIEILVKMIIPAFAKWLTKCLRRTKKRHWACCCCAPLRFIIRFCTLIFAYDGQHVQCCKFVFFGHPFQVPDDLPDRDKVLSVVEQFKVKEFEVQIELMELELTLLWNTFFFSVLPAGVIVQVLVKILEVNSDVTKLLYVLRRPVPLDDKTLRREINAYSWCSAVASVGWILGLSLITYNDKLYEWGPVSDTVWILIGLCLYMLFGSIITFLIFNRCTDRRRISGRISPDDAATSQNLS